MNKIDIPYLWNQIYYILYNAITSDNQISISNAIKTDLFELNSYNKFATYLFIFVISVLQEKNKSVKLSTASMYSNLT